MASKRAVIPADSFVKRPSALEKLTGRGGSDEVMPESGDTVEPQEGNTVVPQGGDTVLRQGRNTVKPQYGETVSRQSGEAVLRQGGDTVEPQDGETATSKVTFYLREDQIDQLDEWTLEYKKRRGKRINRNELVRRLIDRCALDLLLGEEQ
jgi:hypothetical protein